MYSYPVSADRTLRSRDLSRMSYRMDPFVQFRRREQALQANAVAVLQAPAALRVALAWRAVRIEFEPPETEPPESEAECWLWIWSGVDTDETALSQAAGVCTHDLRYWLNVLIRNRMIYPDGSVAEIVETIAQRQIGETTLPRGL